MQLKNMVSALFQSRDDERGGTRHFSIKGCNFGWSCIEDMYSREISRLRNGQCSEIERKPHSQRFMDSSQCSAIKSYAGMLFLLWEIEYYAVS